MANSPKLRAILDAADRRIDAGQGIEHDEFWRHIEAKQTDQGRSRVGKKRATKR